jgi:protein-S-isoprenylcysteine O-methyltransferase Ste14
MKRAKVILQSALIGATFGAVAVRLLRPHRGSAVPEIFDRDLMRQWPWVCAALGWVVFSLYWEYAARNASHNKQRESEASRGVHVAMTNIALLLIMVPLRGVRFAPLSTPVMIVGLLVEAGGLALAILARRHLGRNWSGEISIKVDHQLIRSGPYRKLRHPIYTGLLAMYAGAAIVTGTWVAVGGFVVAIFAYARKIRLEETNLEVAFGAEYDSYRKESWALLPGLF